MSLLRVLAVCDDPPVHDLPTSAGHTLIAAEVLSRLAEMADLQVAYFAAGAHSAVCVSDGDVALPLQRRSASRAHLPDSVAQRVSPDALEAVSRLSDDADVTYVHGLGAFGVLDHLRAPAVVNEVDPWSLFWRDRARDGARGTWGVAHARALRVRRIERAAARRAAAYLVVNPNDAQELGTALGCPVRAIPNGVISPNGLPTYDGAPRIVFLGSLDYPPNIDSATVLSTEVLPRVRQVVPNAQVVLAGRRPVPAVLALARDGVEILADVADPLPVLASAAVGVFAGGFGRGTRNSVLEAIRCGVPVVASTASARGIPRGLHLTVADTADATATAVTRLLVEGPDGWSRAAARRAGMALPDWDGVTDQYLAVLAAAATRSPSRLRSIAGGRAS